MVLLWAVVIGVLVGFLRRGSLAHLAQLRLRGLWLIVMALVIQVLIFPLGSAGPLVTVGTTWLHLTSYLFLLVFTGLNRRYPEILVMGAGLLLNLIAIAANGGYMPASAEALRQAGLAGVAAALEQGTRQGNIVLMGPKTRLNFLGDFLYLPAAVPLSSAFSIGDVVLAVGFVLLLARRMVRPRAGHGSPPPPNTNPDHRQAQGPP
ncbi:DUF5317 domain-containing protein [Candidatus Bipolaricaulota bacterium]|nr:DUF5317 domain-containing protein [Candidatus Bipolaricaulota bacterium]